MDILVTGKDATHRSWIFLTELDRLSQELMGGKMQKLRRLLLALSHISPLGRTRLDNAIQ